MLGMHIFNELPRSRADEVSKQPQLLRMKLFVFFFSSLRFDILMNCIFVSMSAYGVHIVALCPKFPTPKLLFYFRMQPENLLRCNTFYCPNYLRRTHRGNTLYQKMNMILVCSYLYKLHLVSFRYFNAYFLQAFINCFRKNNSPIFCRAHIMIQQNRYIMTLMDIFTHHIKIISKAKQSFAELTPRD